MAKEEKASTSASSLTRLEHHVSVELWAQALVEQAKACQVVVCVDGLEDVYAMESHRHLLVQCQHIRVAVWLFTVLDLNA
jgi:hypothetical protein